MARNTSPKASRKRNKISPPENGDYSTLFNDPAIIEKIGEAQKDLERERLGDRAKFEVAFNDADRLHYVKVEHEFGTKRFGDFAEACGRPRSTAADLLKLHGHREDGTRWFDARLYMAGLKGDKRPNLSWQAYAKDKKLIRKTTSKGKARTANGGNSQPDQEQVAQLTTERDSLKAEVERLQNEYNQRVAEIKQLQDERNRLAAEVKRLQAASSNEENGKMEGTA